MELTKSNNTIKFSFLISQRQRKRPHCCIILFTCTWASLRGSNHQKLIQMSDTIINTQQSTVWWSVRHVCHKAQSVRNSFYPGHVLIAVLCEVSLLDFIYNRHWSLQLMDSETTLCITLTAPPPSELHDGPRQSVSMMVSVLWDFWPTTKPLLYISSDNTIC